jgi:hypothetical protein
MRTFRAILLFAMLAALMPAARALDGIASDWRMIGQGEMRWFGFQLYNARLWAPPAGWSVDGAYALELRYARDIPAQRLVQASIEEMSRLGAEAAQLPRWRAALEQVFPDVRPGDVIVGLHRPGTGAEFYHQGRLTGRIDDPEFARAFFAIWLDPRTREPALRARLLGQG